MMDKASLETYLKRYLTPKSTLFYIREPIGKAGSYRLRILIGTPEVRYGTGVTDITLQIARLLSLRLTKCENWIITRSYATDVTAALGKALFDDYNALEESRI